MQLAARFLLLIAGLTIAMSHISAQQAPPPRGNVEFAALKAQFDVKVKESVLQAYDAGIAELNTQYVASLERALGAAQKSGKLDDALAIKSELEAVSHGRGIPRKDDAATPAPLKQLRETFRAAVARADTQRDKRLQPIQAAFSKDVDALLTRLTKEGRLDEAMAVKRARDTALAAEPFTDRIGIVRALQTDLISEAQLVARPWKFQTAVYTFHADKTVVTARGAKGTWTMKDNVLRADLNSINYWVEFSRKLSATEGGIALDTINSRDGPRPDAKLIQAAGP